VNEPQAPRRDVFFFLSWITVSLLRLILYPLVACFARKPKDLTPQLLIGAGAKGWDLIEYHEIYQSACEFYGELEVRKLSFPTGARVLPVFLSTIREMRPSLYFFDPRSGSQQKTAGIWEAFVIGLALSYYGVTPVCSLTDFPVRIWRLQCAIVSARRGVVTTLMSPNVVGQIFPHSRLIGPMPFPLSVATMRKLSKNQASEDGGLGEKSRHAIFVGSLYEPRKTTLLALKEALEQAGIELEIIGRLPEGRRITNNDYWDLIQSAALVVSTSSQISGPHTDFAGHHHLIYRFVEATAAGSVLVIEPALGVERFFEPDIDFVSYTSVEEAASKIMKLWSSPSEILEMSRRGQAKAQKIVEEHFFWREIDRLIL